MERLNKTVKAIKEPDRQAEAKAKERLAQQARPAGSLGRLEEIAVRLAGINGNLDVRLDRRVVVTCAGDHGVAQEGVSPFPAEVTPQMVYNFIDGGASVNILADCVQAQVRVADLGVNHRFDPDLPIFDKKIGFGTQNMANGPAMSRQEAIKAIEAGIEIVDALSTEKSIDLLATGDMGIGNTTASAAIISVLSGEEPQKVTGCGAGLDGQGLLKKIAVIERSIAINQPEAGDPLDVLAKVGGFEIGGLAGLVLGAAGRGIPVICDGLISTAGALLACEIAPQAKDYLFASHQSVEQGHRYMNKRLGLEPLLDLGMRLGEGTGAVMAMPILVAATRVLAEIKTFNEAGVSSANGK